MPFLYLREEMVTIDTIDEDKVNYRRTIEEIPEINSSTKEYKYLEKLQNGEYAPYTKTCACCGQFATDSPDSKHRNIRQMFYRDVDNVNSFDGLFHWCKECMIANADTNGVIDRNKLIKVLSIISKPFNAKAFKGFYDNGASSKEYFQKLVQSVQYSGKTFFEFGTDLNSKSFHRQSKTVQQSKIKAVEQDKLLLFEGLSEIFDFNLNTHIQEEDVNELQNDAPIVVLSPEDRFRLSQKWGTDKDDAELQACEDKYDKICATHFRTKKDIDENEDGIITKVLWERQKLTKSGDVAELKKCTDAIKIQDESLGIRRIDQKDHSSVMSISKILGGYGELKGGNIPFYHVQEKYELTEDLLDKTETARINSTRHLLGVKPINSIFDLDNPESEFYKRSVLAEHIDEYKDIEDDSIIVKDFDKKYNYLEKEYKQIHQIIEDGDSDG